MVRGPLWVRGALPEKNEKDPLHDYRATKTKHFPVFHFHSKKSATLYLFYHLHKRFRRCSHHYYSTKVLPVLPNSWFMFDIAGKDRLWKTFCFARRFQGVQLAKNISTCLTFCCCTFGTGVVTLRIGVCTDRAAAMTGRKSGLVARVTVTETSTSTHVSTVLNDIQQLSHYFHEYFGDDDTRMFDWIRNPFESQLTD